MLTKLLGLDEVGPITYFEFLLRHPWPGLVALVLVAAAIAYAAFLYRRERSLPVGRRVLLGVLRAAVLGLVMLLVFEPILGLEMIVKLPRTVLVLLDTSESMGFHDPRQTETELKDAALALGKIPFEEASRALPEKVISEVGGATRLDLAKGLLDNPNLKAFERLGQDFTVRYFGFGDHLEPTTGKGEVVADALRRAAPMAKVTRMGTAVEEAVSRSTGQPIAGVILLTDGASNEGLEPTAVAGLMRERGIPLYPIGLGLPHPLDVRLQGLLVPDTIFAKDRVPVRIQVASTGYAGRAANLTVSLDGKEVATKSVTLSNRPQFEELVFIPEEKAGSANLEVAIAELPGESTNKNNRVAKTVRVIDEKIKVLYVEGRPRWEYRYLRQVLLRDHRLDTQFLLTEGDRDLAASSPQYLTDFPEEAGKAFHFDLVILGDVPASYFSHTQLARMEELVQKAGGSFLMLAGTRYAPLTYMGTPIASLLPVNVRNEGWQSVDDAACPIIPTTGAESAVMTLDVPKQRNQELWSLVRPLFKIPVLEGAKPGATVLAELARGGRSGEPYPLIAWQRYGSGKSMFIGTDQLWRIRFKQGDKYHARFWGQAVQFLTLSRLLGENKRIQIEADSQDYRAGERVQVTANVLDEAYEPVKVPAYNVYLDRLEPAKETTPLRLESVPGIRGLFQGFVTPEQPGRYVIRAAPGDQAVSSAAEFAVKASSLEDLERAMQEDLLKKMAEVSGGRFFTVRDLPDLVKTIGGDERTTVIRRERELWDLPIVFGLVLALLTVEWLLRRRYDLV